MPTEFEALVIAAYGRHLLVREPDGSATEARPLGRRLDIVCGDQVACVRDDAHGEVHVARVLPRRSALFRADARGRAESVVANLSLMLVVVAALPKPDLFIVDRYLCAAASAGVVAIVVMNKTDLPGSDALRGALASLVLAGYRVVECRADSDGSLQDLRELLAGATAVLVGQSGVGKSSIVARLTGDAAVPTAALAGEDEGRHTTTVSRLYDLEGGGALIDSPGVRDFAPAISVLEARALGFVEIEALAPRCRFADCRHLEEPACAVRAAVDAGSFDARRYESYRRLRRLYSDVTAVKNDSPTTPRSGRPRRPGRRDQPTD
jgi:ribosome biogenesis GTPase